MAANADLPAHFPIEFDNNWSILTQELMNRLKAWVQVDTVQGQEKQYNQVGSKEWQSIQSRGSQTVITDTPTAKRVLRPAAFDTADTFDEWDQEFLGNVVLPTSDVMTVHAAGYNRLLDRTIISAANGTATVPVVPAATGGQITYTTVVLPSTQKVAIDFNETSSPANASMTLAKLRQAKFIFDDNDVDESEIRVIALCAKELNSLLRDAQIGNYFFNDVKAWVDGQLDQFMGFTLKRVSSTVNPAVSGVRLVPAWVQSGIKLADSGRRAYMDILPMMRHALQMRSTASLGATRMEEKKVVQIACDTTLA